MPPPKPQVRRNSFVCVFCLILCINVVLLTYIAMHLNENQTQFEILRRTDEIKNLQLLQDRGLKQYQAIEMIQSVHYRKTKDQRVHGEYDEYRKQYLDMKKLEELAVKLQNENMENMRAQSVQYQVEQDLKVLETKEHDQKYGNYPNRHEDVLEIQDEAEEEVKEQDRKKQDLNSMEGQKEQEQKEKGQNVHGINIQFGNEQDLKLQEQSMYDSKEEHDLKVEQGEEDEGRTTLGEENPNNRNKYVSFMNMYYQGTHFPNMESIKTLSDKEEQGTDVQVQTDDSRDIQNRDEQVKEEESQYNTSNTQVLQDEDSIVQVQKDDSQGIQDREEHDRKKQYQAKQYDEEPNLKVHHIVEENDTVTHNPNQQHVTIQDKNGQNLNAQGWKDEQRDKKKLQVQNQVLQEQTEEGMQDHHQLLKENLKSQVGHNFNDQVMYRPNALDVKVYNQIIQEDQTEIGLRFDDQTVAKLWTRHRGPQKQNVNDQQLVGVTETLEVSEVQTVPDSEMSHTMKDNSHESEQEMLTTTVVARVNDD